MKRERNVGLNDSKGRFDDGWKRYTKKDVASVSKWWRQDRLGRRRGG